MNEFLITLAIFSLITAVILGNAVMTTLQGMALGNPDVRLASGSHVACLHGSLWCRSRSQGYERVPLSPAGRSH